MSSWKVLTRHWGNNLVKEKYTMTQHGIHGEFRSYHNDGTPHVRTNYHYGKLHGDFEEYTKKGVLMMKSHYHMDLLHGEVLLYNVKNLYGSHDVLYSSTMYVMGGRHGPFIIYDRKNAPICKSWWHDDNWLFHYEGELSDKQKFIIEMTGKSPFAEK
jgi:antitoxin component YwqK of YwqJK toxin-antitoxin module